MGMADREARMPKMKACLLMMVTSAQRVGRHGGEVFSTGDMAMTKIIETSRAEVEVALF